MSKKRFRTAETHPSGISNKAWPTKLVPNAIYLDEVGQGAWMGPLSVGAVYLLDGFEAKGIHDSKLLKPHEREKVYEELKSHPLILFHVEHISNAELDDLGGLGKAWKEAMKRAVSKMSQLTRDRGLKVERVILDGNKTFESTIPVECFVKADSIYTGVSAAAIMAKVERDKMMERLSANYPEFEKIMKNGKGYRFGVAHDDLIARGVYTDLHRKTYNPLKSVLADMLVPTKMLVALHK
jgi:ribonuclease HII